MWIKGWFFTVYVKAGKFRIFIPLPLYVLRGILWDFIELMDLVGWKRFRRHSHGFGRKQAVSLTHMFDCLLGSGRYDLVDIAVKDKDQDIIVQVKVV
ncbi:MAG: hypothetical protein R6W96_08655 [Clostridia bacterium]